MARKTKRVYLAVMLVSAGALVVDSFVLSSDLPEAGFSGAQDAVPQGASSPVPELAIPELPFPRGITSIDPEGDIPDLFAPPRFRTDGPSAGADTDKLTDGADRLSGPGHLSSAAFRAAHRLNGVMVYQRLRIADVDGQWIRRGTSVDGCALINIAPREVTFQCYDDEAILTLNHPATDSRH